MPTVRELREKRANIWSQAQGFDSRKKAGDTLSAEEETAWTRALDEVDSLGTEIENLERTAGLDKRFAEIEAEHAERKLDARGGAIDERTPEVDYRDAWNLFMRRGSESLTVEQRTLLQANFRAQAEGTGSAGGYTVPTDFWAKVTETMKWYGGGYEGAEIINTSAGNPIVWPTNDDTANVGYQLGENVQASGEGDLVFGQKALGSWTFVSGPILVPIILSQDSAIDFEGLLTRKMGERLGRIKNTKLTTGAGTTTPQGFVTGISAGVTTASATAITYDEIIDLIHSIDPAYRMSGRCQFKMNDLIIAKIRKLRDDSGGAGLGRPLWEPSIQAGKPDTLLGYNLVVNNDMDSAATATKKVMAFGDFQACFVVRNVAGGAMMRLTERYADYLQVGYLGYERYDSLVQDASAVKLMVMHA